MSYEFANDTYLLAFFYVKMDGVEALQLQGTLRGVCSRGDQLVTDGTESETANPKLSVFLS